MGHGQGGRTKWTLESERGGFWVASRRESGTLENKELCSSRTSIGILAAGGRRLALGASKGKQGM